ncbi:hypothetical protein CAPTEDRAFT_211578 [Capitella teleta]|uniref:Aminotransferase class V domain-containing protein n=1 Tax=Capitella teleta TaxID=283909 RepID=R7TV59_CAPTE|nr:hypothetical protein CAPTEDRAFT_211578 [Capitella teleta]|eukprot:ELT95331.1 hypothetical protein CAPTEDRAFT_211578 [Capitella teleta]
MPVKEISLLCHQNGVTVVVDGAHAPGNLHKWMFTPRGCALLWVSPALRPLVKPCVISHFHGVSLHFDHCIRGTRDDTPYHCVGEALDFIEGTLGGLGEIQTFVAALLDKSMDNLLQSWNTTTLQMDSDLQAPFMRLIKIPDPKGASYIEAYLYLEHRIRILCMFVEGDLFLRLSASVYTDESDFEALNQAVLTMMQLSEVPEYDPGYDLPIMHWDLRPLVIPYPEH